MRLNVNSAPHATIIATLLTLAQRYTADQSILVTCMQLHTAALYSVQEICTRKKLEQETATDEHISCASRVAQDSCTSFLTVCQQHKTIIKTLQTFVTMKTKNDGLTLGIYATPRTTSSFASGLDNRSSGRVGNNSLQTCISCSSEHKIPSI